MVEKYPSLQTQGGTDCHSNIQTFPPPDTGQAHPLNDHFTAREQKTLPEKGLSDEQSRNALRESLMDLKDILFLPNLKRANENPS